MNATSGLQPGEQATDLLTQRWGDAMHPTHDAATPLLTRVRAGEAGEGVISTAIAVLIMAFIGAAMWVVFNNVFEDASGKVEDQVAEIGN